MKVFTLEEVIQSMLISDINPAYKAHATRRLNQYAYRRSIEINARPSQIKAAVKAAVTKRLNGDTVNRRLLCSR
jgi:hypothetical protein